MYRSFKYYYMYHFVIDKYYEQKLKHPNRHLKCCSPERAVKAVV
jgi:hypothetical protein